MKTRIIGTMAIAALMAFAPSRTRAQGLYGDGKNTTTGDLMDQDYWWAKFDRDMLELAIKQHQPEGRIDLNLARSINRLNDLIKKYPKHEELPKWKARAEEIEKMINPERVAQHRVQRRFAVGRVQLRAALGELALRQDAP